MMPWLQASSSTLGDDAASRGGACSAAAREAAPAPALAEGLRRHGCEVACTVYPRMWHVLVGYCDGYGRGTLTPAVRAIESFAAFIRAKAAW